MNSHVQTDSIDRLKNIQREKVYRGEQVWDLSMVNPDMQPPRLVMDRLLEFVTKGNNHRYAVSRGVRRLRDAFAAKYDRAFSQSVNPDTEVCVCLGSKDGVFNVLRYVLSAGDKVVVSSPSYSAHLSAVELVGGHVVPWKLQGDHLQDVERLEQLLKDHAPKVLLLNIPANPTGMVVGEDWWRPVAKICAQYDVLLINDFVYGEMCFSGVSATSALMAREHGARCVEVYSLSKAYNVPGWRVGAIMGTSEIVSGVARLKSQADYGLFLPLQYAASFALSSQEDLVAETVQTYQRRLRVLTAGLEECGCEVKAPQAGACLWVRLPTDVVSVGGVSSESTEFAIGLLEAENLVVTPGVLFGAEYDSYVRLAAVTNEERLREAAGRMRKFIERRRQELRNG
jgi:alanine-synthesizing transaminase